ncbi:MAG: PIN domain-containing protein [Acidobacteriota bacterium]|nr:PIN domain-containing protein [Acidobacteriota bacterium]
MADIVMDTHTAIWYFANSPEISALATQTIDNAVTNGDSVILATISIVEIVYLIDKRKLVPQTLSRLIQNLKLPNNSFVSQDLTEDIAQTLQQIPRSTVPDMPDRIIDATALHLNLPLVSKDRKIQALQSIQIVW